MHAPTRQALRSAAAALAVIATLCASCAAAATDSSVGFGVGVAPEFIGARKYLVVPLPSFSVAVGRVEIRSNDLGLEAAVPLTGFLEAGPIIRLDAGRNSLFRTGDPVIRQLRRVNAAPEAGAFVAVKIPLWDVGLGAPPLLLGRVSTVRGGGDGHRGALVEASLGGLLPLTPSTAAGLSLQASYQDRRYAAAYFDVTVADAARTGLAPFRAAAGLRDIGAAAFLDHRWSRHWSTTLTGSFTRLRDAAAASPIVTARGRVDQAFGGVSITYSF